jgi:hypothetical protein
VKALQTIGRGGGRGGGRTAMYIHQLPLEKIVALTAELSLKSFMRFFGDSIKGELPLIPFEPQPSDFSIPFSI